MTVTVAVGVAVAVVMFIGMGHDREKKKKMMASFLLTYLFIQQWPSLSLNFLSFLAH